MFYCIVLRDVFVTGVTSIGKCIPVQGVQLLRSNSSFDNTKGNPYSVLEQEVIDDDDDDDDAVSVGSDKSTSSTNSTDSLGLFGGDHHFTNRYCYILDGVNQFVLVSKNTKHSGTSLSD